MRKIAVAWVLIVGAGVAHAKNECSKASMRKARAAADKSARAKDYAKAIATLEAARKACDGASPDAVEEAWLVGDLAVAYWKSGNLLACRQLMEEETFPKSDASRAGNDKLMGALEYNLEQCEKAFDAQYAALKSDACPLTIDDAAAAAALPASLFPKGATAACVAIVPDPTPPAAPAAAAGDDVDADSDVSCPRLAVVSKGKGGKIDRKLLGAGDSNLVDFNFCCGLNTIAVGIQNGKALIRVGADTWVRECHGGTATTSLDAIFEWKGNALTTVVDASTIVW